MSIISDETRAKRNAYSKKWREKHHEQFLKMRREYYKNNKEKYAQNNKKWYEKNYKKNYANYIKSYAREYCYKKRKTDPLYYQKYRIRNFILRGFSRKGFTKRSHSTELLGCDFQTFYKYLLTTFENNYGYKYDGQEKVHIDHIIPLNAAQTIEEVEKLSHYTNLQLLKAKDNLKKSNKLNYTIGG